MRDPGNEVELDCFQNTQYSALHVRPPAKREDKNIKTRAKPKGKERLTLRWKLLNPSENKTSLLWDGKPA